MMRRALLPLLGLGCLLALLLVFYGSVLFRNAQFIGGNASYFDYPLYLHVQQEWDAGRWPLWDPGQNGGAPLLGNPLCAVFYPGKLLHAALPYSWAARLYVIAHVALAFLGLLALARTLGLSWVGSFLGALCYAFGAPVLCQYVNTMRLVGAAWIPWGFWALDRLLRQERRRGAAELAVVLALQVLAGDPEAAYLTAASGGLYALALTCRAPTFAGWVRLWWALPAALCLWVLGSLGWAAARIGAPRFVAANGLVLAAWAAAAVLLGWRWYRRPGQSRLTRLLARLAAACALAAALAAVQILPALEFLGQSWRSEGVPASNRYRYSVDLFRVAELAWPNVFGLAQPENHSWLQAIWPRGEHEVWIDSLYMSGMALCLALSAAGWSGGPAWRGWLTAVALLALTASFGRYASPLWWLRGGEHAAALGAAAGAWPARNPSEPTTTGARNGARIGNPSHTDAQDPGEPAAAGDGTGSPFALLCLILPGFSAFRYPSKLLPLAAAALAVLAAAGWDLAAEGHTRGLRRVAGCAVVASALGLALAIFARGQVVASLAERPPSSPLFGPGAAAGAWAETQRALAHGAIVFAAVLVLAHWALRRPRLAGSVALVVLAVDLAVANARLVSTIPQSDCDAPSEAARLIEAAERADPAPGPYRVHRMAGWFPAHFAGTGSAGRFRELTAWARQTLHPLLGLPLGLEYCQTIGSLEVDDYVALFQPALVPVPAPTARILGVPAGSPVVYFPRRSFDLWGARYFILPAAPDWMSRQRGFASFLDKTELIYPTATVLYERPSGADSEPWSARQDWQLRRNLAAYPRAWIVHDAQVRPPPKDADTRARRIRSLIYMNDLIWSERNRPVFDLRRSALIESEDAGAIKTELSQAPASAPESVSFSAHQPQRVELKAVLQRPGLVILADTYYPGWQLTIDGKPAPILRANRMMRAAAVTAGEHTLVFTYAPLPFRVGAIVSAAGLGLLVVVSLTSRIRRPEPERPELAGRSALPRPAGDRPQGPGTSTQSPRAWSGSDPGCPRTPPAETARN
jgi:Bacterial membrane protein YfhO